MIRCGRTLIIGLSLAAVVGSQWAAAQAFPSKPIRVLSNSASSSPGDVSLRLVAPKVSASIGQPVLIELRTGGAGQVAALETRRAAPDGYTLMFSSSGTVVGASLLQKDLAVDVAKELVPVSRLSQVTNFIVIHGSIPAATVREFVDLAGREPGKYSFSSNGVGSGIHLNGVGFMVSTGADLLHVPYGSGNDSQRYGDFVAGRLSLAFAPYTTIRPYLSAGKVKVIATSDERRNKHLPDVPAITEVFPDYRLVPGWWGLFGPPALPQPVISRLVSEIQKACRDPEILAKLEELDINLIGSTSQELGAVIRKQEAVIAELVKAAGLTPR